MAAISMQLSIASSAEIRLTFSVMLIDFLLCRLHFWLYHPIPSNKIQYDSSRKMSVVASQFIGKLVKHTFKLETEGTTINPPEKQAYPEGAVAIKPEKINDIKRILSYILDKRKGFFSKIIDWERAGNKGELNILLPNFSPYRSLLKVTSKETVLSHKSVHAQLVRS
uniref:Uncharacterized protein n=1 Tax=Timema tahoe TaxID=61484 RepID=A0A7R9IJV1_9NEOP|nr:unnamed protein product [Timema tahoe]